MSNCDININSQDTFEIATENYRIIQLLRLSVEMCHFDHISVITKCLPFSIEIISNFKILEQPYFAQNLQLAAVTPVHQKKTSIAKKYI